MPRIKVVRGAFSIIGLMVGSVAKIYLDLKATYFWCNYAARLLNCSNIVMLSEKRDKTAASAFFKKALGASGIAYTITMDKSGANKAGIDEINLQLALLFMFGGIFYQIDIRQIKYLNNIVEQDHRFIKKITKAMKGFKSFESAEATISGIELHHMLKKGQHSQAANMTIFDQFNNLAA